MSDQRLTQLLDRAVGDAPHMHLSGEDMLAAGKGRVRRRRAVGVGGTLGAAAIVAAVWGGLTGGAGGILSTTDIQPATTVWEQGETVDGTLFAVQTIDDARVAHSYEAQLSRPTGEGPVTLLLSDRGAVVEEIEAQSPVPGLEVFAGERMTVAVWTEPEGVVTSVPVVGPHDPGGPSGVERAEVQGEELAYAVWAGDVVAMPERVVDVYLVGEDDAVTLSGEALETAVLRAGDQRAVSFVDTARGVWGSFLTAPRDHAGSGTTAPLAGPAQTGSAAFGWDGSTTSMAVLPEGAEDVRVEPGGRGGRADTADVAGRPVTLWVVEDDAAAVTDEAVTFTLAGAAHDLAGYATDLRGIDLADGSTLDVVPGQGEEDPLILDDPTGAGGTTLDAASLAAGLVTEPLGGSLVTVAVGWDAGARPLSESRVEVTNVGASRWVSPTDVAQVVLADGRLATVLAVDAAENATVSAVGRQAGAEVERWEPETVLADGLAVRELAGALVPVVEGQVLQPVDDGTLGDVRHYAGPSGSDVGYLVAPGAGVFWTLVPVVEDGDGGVRLAPDALVESWSSDRFGGTVLAVDSGLVSEGRSRVVGLAAETGGGGDVANTWRLLGSGDSAHLVVDPRAVVTVAAEQGLWLLYPQGATDPGQLEVGRIGESVLRLPAGTDAGGAGQTLVAVHPEDAPLPRVDDAGSEPSPTATHEIADLRLVVRTWAVEKPAG